MASRFVSPVVVPPGDTGEALPGAKLYFYVNGSTTVLKNVYAELALSTALSNPVVADGDGRFVEIFGSGSYSVKLTDSDDNVVWGPFDDISFDREDSVSVTDAMDSAVSVAFTIEHQTSGTPANGIGVAQNFDVETTNGVITGLQIQAVSTDVGVGTEDFDVLFRTRSAGSLISALKIPSAGGLDLLGFKLILDADGDSSFHASTDDQLDVELGGADRLRFTTAGIAQVPVTGITAGTTQTQAGATALTAAINVIGTCANSGDGVKLPTALAGLRVTVTNKGAQPAQVWPSTDDKIDGGSADAVDPILLRAGASRTYYCKDGVDWYTERDGTLKLSSGATVYQILDEDDFASDSDEALTTQQAAKAYIDTIASSNSGQKSGLTLSNNSTDAEHDIDITTGSCTDSTNAVRLSLSSAFTKRIDATWASGTGNGGLASGATLANATWYHVFIVRVGGSDDVMFDTSVTCANGVANNAVTHYRRIGSVLTDGSANIVAFTQNGDEFRFVPVNDVANTSPGTSALTATLSVPTNVSVLANVSVSAQAGSGSVNPVYILLTNPSVADTAPSVTLFSIAANVAAGTALSSGGMVNVPTNTSAQIRYRSSTTDTNFIIRITTHGWREFF